MNCPHCNVSLVMAERSGVEIDYCPQCRGIWLDRGELDKSLERSAQVNSRQTTYVENRQVAQHTPQDQHYNKHNEHDRHDDKHGKYTKKKSWIGDVFDF